MNSIDMSTHDPVKLHKELIDTCICLRTDGDKHPVIGAFLRLDMIIRGRGELPPVWQTAVDDRRRDRESVFVDITDERNRQDEKWGGAAHDDEHSPMIWAGLVTRHAMRACDGDVMTIARFRKQMVRAASLAVAAIESCDRAAKRASDKPDRGELASQIEKLQAERDAAKQKGYEIGWKDGRESVLAVHAGRAYVLFGLMHGLRVPEDKPRKRKGQQAHDVDLGDEDRRPEEDED